MKEMRVRESKRERELERETICHRGRLNWCSSRQEENCDNGSNKRTGVRIMYHNNNETQPRTLYLCISG